MRERRLGHQVVGETVRELRERIRRRGGDDEEVGSGQVRVGILGRRPAGQGREGPRPDEAVSPGGHERDDIVPALDEQPDEVAGLVRRDSAGHTEKHPRHKEDCARCPPDAGAALPGVLVVQLAL